jgi:peptidyl-tRNA hydrolase
MDNPTLYIFINKSLNMSSGKVASQAAHAAAMSMARNHIEDNDLWIHSIHKTIIVLEARDEMHLRNIKDYLAERTVESGFIIDEGANEVEHLTITALATHFMDKNAAADKLFSGFKLYKEDTAVDVLAFMKGAESIFGRQF